MEGAGHGNQINSMRVHDGILYTAGIDDSLKQIDIEGEWIHINAKNYYLYGFYKIVGNAYKPQDLKLGSQPRGMDILKDQNIIVVASVNEIAVVKDNRKISTLKVSYEPTSVSCSPRGHIAIGGSVDNKVRLLIFFSCFIVYLQSCPFFCSCLYLNC